MALENLGGTGPPSPPPSSDAPDQCPLQKNNNL